MKKFVSILILFSGLFLAASTTFASEPIKIFVKGEEILTDTDPIFERGRVLVPVRAIAEALDASVTWNGNIKTASVHKWSESIHLTAGKKDVQIEGKYNIEGEIINGQLTIDVSVKIVNNRVFIPLRAVSELLGYNVHWANHTVYINTPKNSWGTYDQEGLLKQDKAH